MLTAQFDLSQRNPFVAGHVVRGRALLPGLAYVDLILQVFAKHGHRFTELELRNLTLTAPLAVPEGASVPLTVTAQEDRPGVWRVEVTARPAGGPAPVLHASAEVHRGAPAVFDARIDPAAERAGAREVTDLDEVYRHCRTEELTHSGAMKALGRVHHLPAAVLIDVEVPAEARADAAEFLAHPALLDACAVAGGYAHSRDRHGQPLHLPLCYESFRISAPLTARCQARITADAVRRTNDLLSLSLEFFDEHGQQVAELRGFTSKPAHTPQAPAPTATPAPAAPAPGGGAQLLLCALLADELSTAPAAVDTRAGFYEMGLDSAALLRVVGALQRRLDRTLPPTLLFEHTTVEALAGWLETAFPDAESTVGATAANSTAANTTAAATAAVPASSTAAAPRPAAAPAAPAAPGDTDLAVIGMSGRYPGAGDLDAFWDNLRSGRDCVTPIPEDRWDPAAHRGGRPGELGYSYCERGGFIDGADRFDPLFFAIAPREAVAIDPLERLFLEHSWSALEDAGYTRAALRGSVGVYAGVMFQDYPLFAAEHTGPDGRRVGLGAGGASIANRVSYVCDFHGPSMMVDTSCSSSLTTLHLAARALRAGEVDAALVGGVNLSLHPNKYLVLSQGEFLSAQGRCAAFGAGADGMVPGEGVGVLVLKRLRDAERDGDHIHGVIKGTAVNHGGKASGFTVPNPQAQHDVIAAALQDAGVDPATVSYVEAHGTGTELGDPIEVAGLTRALGTRPAGAPTVAVGSVKSGIGHLEAAAGIAGVTKVLLQMRHGELAPTLHADEPNPRIDFTATPLTVNTALRPWQRPVVGGQEVPRRAGVSSFGAGGSNAHVVLEEYRDPRDRSAGLNGPAVVVLSARDGDRLREYAARLRDFVAGAPSAAAGATAPDGTLRRLTEIAAKVRGVAPADLDPDADLTAAGFEGIAGARLLLGIGREFGLSLPPTAVHDHPSLTALARQLHTAERAVDGPGGAAPAAAPRALPTLHALAHTLLTGREALAERLAVVVSDLGELAAELDAFLAGTPSPKLFHGNTTGQRAARDRELVGDRADELIRAAVHGGDLTEPAQLWVSGVPVSWDLLHPRRPVRTPLPTYPFARERHWITDALTGGRPAPAAAAPPAVAPPAPAGPPPVPAAPSLLAEVEEAVVTRPRVYEVESSLTDLAAYQDTVAELSHVCRVSLLSTFRSMGALCEAGERTTRDGLRDRLAVAPQHGRLFDALLGLLAEAGYVRLDGDAVITAEVTEHDLQAEVDQLAERKRALLERAPDNDGLLAVLDACLRAYPQVLTGRKDPLDVLFPGGSFDLMDQIYKNQQQTNALMVQVVDAYVRERLARDPQARVTLLEIGAGTGGTSRGVLAALEPHADRLRYLYTDLGSSFVQYGAKEYGGHSFVEFQQLDVERSPQEQGFAAGEVDVVIASNVLHATRDIGRTLAHAKSLMRPGGLLALFEITRLHELLTIAFGLLEGWWAFEDERLPGSPLLSVPMWRRATERVGFRGMRVLSGMPLREDRLSESVLLAESDGAPVDLTRAAAPAAPAAPPAPAPAAVQQPAPVTAPAPHPTAPVAPPAQAPAPAPAETPAAAPAPTGGPVDQSTGDDIERLVREAWQEVLGVAHVGPEDSFQALGGDSIMASRIKARLNDGLPFELELRDLMTADTVLAMARLVETEVIEKIDELPEDTVRAMFAN
ncbi:beta-ketoacyl synthase N-terminal-like domain-containing protein [Streptomyces noursei]|uniref:beta-ketoacyl synthase N-terminal-like domain-containing protein n=1 Tax=Streptomyces noursei TaxID=1971 RepID=UPI00331E0FA3